VILGSCSDRARLARNGAGARWLSGRAMVRAQGVTKQERCELPRVTGVMWCGLAVPSSWRANRRSPRTMLKRTILPPRLHEWGTG